eukprot:TRINITY_DN69853_c0_g1_i1.p1 TRINITY_DN69853_c0_g1~~TRINITY_DN69853_c0_g1_i1.p1  ORF type:complete len:324 (+),score=38.61 TRINITY_DN69853_c0_g1_i1:114-1085(+)
MVVDDPVAGAVPTAGDETTPANNVTSKRPRVERLPDEGKMPETITDEQWATFRRDGYVNLGKVIPARLFARMITRLDEIMMGDRQYPELIMQLDPGGTYGTAGVSQTPGFKGATKNYRKIGEAGAGLELDDVFSEAMALPIFRAACAEVHGAHCDIAVYRAMVFNKPGGKGTVLPWHQDGGDWWGLDRDPLIFTWTAIDDSTQNNGCVKVVPGSHRLGLLSRRGHTLSPARLLDLDVENRAVNVEVQAGETVLMHNFLIHSSGVNPTGTSRRALSVNYADGRTRLQDPPRVVQPEGTIGQIFGLKHGQPCLPIIFRQESLPEF